MALEENMDSLTEAPWGTSVPDNHRCRYTNSRGSRCSSRLFNSATGLCSFHDRIWSQESATRASATTEELLGEQRDLEDRDEIHAVLARLFRFTSEKRIERADAGLLAYISSLVLQTLPMRKSAAAEEEDTEFRVVWDIPPLKPEELSQKSDQPSQSPTSIYPPGNAGTQV